MSRREIVAVLAAISAGGPAFALPRAGWASPPGPAQERLSWDRFRTTPDYRRFVDAIRRMKAKADPEHPDSWQFWANIHQRQCPHGKGYFLAWHRGYLALFEARLRSIARSTTLRLPYWDYFSDPRLPEELRTGDAASNPLFETRKGAEVAKALTYRAFAHDVTGFEHGVKNCFETNVEAFHNNVHNLIGGRMATMQSPQDVIFWMHHANIDRLWSAWTQAGQGRGMPAADDPYWQGRMDYARDLTVARADTIATEALGYFYADLALPAPQPEPAPAPPPVQAPGVPPQRPRPVPPPPAVMAPAPMPAPLPAPMPALPAPMPAPVEAAPFESPLIYAALLLGSESAPIRMAISRIAESPHDHRAPGEAAIVLDAVTLTDIGRNGGFFYKLYLAQGETRPGHVPGEENLLGTIGAFQIAVALEHASDGAARLVLPAGELLARLAGARDFADLGVVFVRVDGDAGPVGPAIRIEKIGFTGTL